MCQQDFFIQLRNYIFYLDKLGLEFQKKVGGSFLGEFYVFQVCLIYFIFFFIYRCFYILIMGILLLFMNVLFYCYLLIFLVLQLQNLLLFIDILFFLIINILYFLMDTLFCYCLLVF